MTTDNKLSVKNGDALFTEAPASWNTRYVDPNGFECQLTLRAETGQELLERVSGAITYLLNNDCVPYTYYRGGSRQAKNKTATTTKNDMNGDGNGKNNGNHTWCPIHECEMKRWERDGSVWHSHKVNGDWCRGK